MNTILPSPPQGYYHSNLVRPGSPMSASFSRATRDRESSRRTAASVSMAPRNVAGALAVAKEGNRSNSEPSVQGVRESTSSNVGSNRSPLPSQQPFSAAGLKVEPPEEGDTLSQDPIIDGWSFLLKEAQKNDQKNVGRWKDELDNLLVFAALFSAIVTAFVVQSYPSLQEDPNDRTDAILSRISLQLSSFSVDGDSITSTAPPLSQTSPTFTPDPNDVLINALFFASLTLSVLSAFFAIGMQQWLRSLSLPGHLSLWSTIRLRQRRYRNAIRFQLPNIMALLPALLQISVVLFLLGVFFLLRGLNHRIAGLYAALAGPSFFLYGISLVLPLFWIDCPLKSPLVPSVVFVFSGCKTLFLLITLYAIILPTTFIVHTLQACWTPQPHHGIPHSPLARKLEQTVASFRFRVRVTRSPLVPRSQEFWTEREVRRLYGTQEKATRDYGDALAHAPQLTHRNNLVKLQACLPALPYNVRAKCVLSWVHMYFGNYAKLTFRHTYRYRQWSPISPELVEKVDETFGHTYKAHLSEALISSQDRKDQHWETYFIPSIENIYSILILYTRVVTTGHRDHWSTVVDGLMKVCEMQCRLNIGGGKYSPDVKMYMHVPTACLFRCLEYVDFRFSRPPEDGDLLNLLSLVTMQLKPILPNEQSVVLPLAHDNEVELVFSCVGIILRCLEKVPQPLPVSEAFETVRHIMSAFDQFLIQEDRRIVSVITEYKKKHQTIIVTPHAIKSIAECLHRLNDREPSSYLDKKDVVNVAHHLHQLCVKFTESGQPDAFEWLKDAASSCKKVLRKFNIEPHPFAAAHTVQDV